MKKVFNRFPMVLFALVKFGNGVAEIRGSIAGNTYTRNSYGSVLRQKVTPVNPNTVAQSSARSAFGAVSALWRLLSASDQAAFNAVAPDYTRTNIFGDNVPLTGQGLFMKLSNQLSALGLSITNAAIPPLSLTAPTFTVIDADAAAPAFRINTLAATSADDVIAIYATAPQSGGKSFFGRNQYRLIGVKPISTVAGNFDLAPSYLATFGIAITSLTAGTKIGVFTRRVSIVNGQPSADLTGVGVVEV